MMNSQIANKLRDRQFRLKAERLCKECSTTTHPNYHKFVNATMQQLQSTEATRAKLVKIVQSLSNSSEGPNQTKFINGFNKLRTPAAAL